tara:strand:- start:395 stop:676 length:282 start_codon:yes stop_codon:yes gene_type:complete
MEYSDVKKISAIGTRGDAKNVEFIAKPGRRGRYVLNKKSSSPAAGNNTNQALNKVYVGTLSEAAAMLATNDYLINLVSPDGKRVFSKVSIVSA